MFDARILLGNQPQAGDEQACLAERYPQFTEETGHRGMQRESAPEPPFDGAEAKQEKAAGQSNQKTIQRYEWKAHIGECVSEELV